MKKIVINRDYGLFNLSPKAIKKYLESHGKDCYFYDYDSKKGEFTRIDNEIAFKNPHKIKCIQTEYFGEYYDNNKYYKNVWKWLDAEFKAIRIARDDLNLIKVIEELGAEANCKGVTLKIIEIPDDVEWERKKDEYGEYIIEKHRIWR